MINKNRLLETIKEAKDQIEWHKEEDNKAGYYSFKLDKIGNTPMHRILSDYIYATDLDHNTNYSMLGEGLEVLDEVISSIDREYFNRDDDEIVEGISSQADSGTPIYNNEVMEFVSNNYSTVDEYTKEFGHGESIINDGMGAYYITYENFINGLLDILIDHKASPEYED